MSQGYGTDTWCLDSMVTGRFARGLQVPLQNLYRKFITPRGTLRGGDEELAWGLDLAEYVGQVGLDEAEAILPGLIRAEAILPGLIRAEAMKDDRISDVAVSVLRVDSSNGESALHVTIDGTLLEEGETFSLTFAVDAATVSLIGGV